MITIDKELKLSRQYEGKIQAKNNPCVTVDDVLWRKLINCKEHLTNAILWNIDPLWVMDDQ